MYNIDLDDVKDLNETERVRSGTLLLIPRLLLSWPIFLKILQKKHH